MDVATFCRQSRVLIVAGKGGVGKTTITAALAKMASSSGLNVLVVELEGKSGVPAAFGREHSLDYDEAVLDSLSADGAVRARRITPDDALVEYLADHGMKRISKRLASSGALDVVATAIPGIRDILVLGKVKQLERDDPSDLILVDAPATGHAMTFLSSAKGLLGAARSGPVRAQAADVVELLSDAKRCQVVLVTLPEEMPVNEAVETAYQLEDRIGITLGPVIVNGCLPEDPLLDTDPSEAAEQAGVEIDDELAAALGRAAAFRAHRYRLQAAQWKRLAHELPLPQLYARFLFCPQIGPEELERLETDLAASVGRLEEGYSKELRAVNEPKADEPTATATRSSPPTSDSSRHELGDLVENRSVVVCCGSGGVGKTTVAATFALEAARRGRRACVVTIDPARRLADALGLDTLTNIPKKIEGPWPGELWALMLDPKGTFDDLVRRYAASPEQAEGILANRIYRNLTGASVGNPGVHGHGEALRAGRGGCL